LHVLKVEFVQSIALVKRHIYIYIYGQYFFAMWHTFKDLYLIICGRPNLINFLSVFFLLFWYIDNIQIKPSPVGEHSI